MAIIEGQTAFLRTTGEEVFVLAVVENTRLLPEGSKLSGQVATIRRPVAGENGCYHVAEQFLIEELETQETRLQRHLENQKSFEARMNKAVQEAGLDGNTEAGTDEDLPN